MLNLNRTVYLLLLSTCAACGAEDDGGHDPKSGPPSEKEGPPSADPAGNDGDGTQLTECDTDEAPDGVCDVNAACAAYDPDCATQDEPPPGEPDEGGTQLTKCDTDQVSDGQCDLMAACAAYDPDCGYEKNECPTEVEPDGQCDLEDECWGFDPDCE